MFKQLFMVIILAGVFLSGYYLGRLPGSPDVFAIAQDGYDQAAELGKTVGDAVESKGATSVKSSPSTPVNNDLPLAASR